MKNKVVKKGWPGRGYMTKKEGHLDRVKRPGREVLSIKFCLSNTQIYEFNCLCKLVRAKKLTSVLIELQK